MTRAYVVAGLALGAVVTYACVTETAIGPDVALDSLYIEPDTTSIVLGDTLRLTAVGVDSAGTRFAYTRATWSSGDAAVSVAANGVVIGVATGMATVTATGGTKTATAFVTVTPTPVFATSRDSVPFTGFANGPDPAAQTVTITNAGGGTLTPVVDSITYGPGANSWLAAALATGSPPDTLTLNATTTALAVGTYRATVFLGAPKAAPKTITVTLAVTVDAPFAIAIDSGDAQTATVNTAVPIRPTVLVRDQYANPVPAAAVTFAVTGGGGSVAPVTAVATDAGGKARATSWTLDTAAGANALQASVPGVTPVTFNATGTAGAPAATAKTAGDSQSVTVNSAVPVLPTLRVTDQFGNPVESVSVTFAVGLGAGGVTGGTRKTDGAGQAPVGSWTLGTQAGQNTLTATATGLPAATFFATGTAAAADTISLNGGNNQTDTVAATLGTPYTVRVADQYGNGVQGTSVTWGATGGGSITPNSSTNSAGIASATRVLGTGAGPQGATASVAGLGGSPVAFSATATHGAATTILKFAGDNQSATAGSPVANAPTARVVDQFGNAVPGVNVAFAVDADGGSVSPTTPIPTDTAGKAAVSTWTLGITAGPNRDTLTASSPGLVPARFVASPISGAAKNLVYVSGTGQTDTIGATLATYTVRVTDSLSNGVQGVTVSWVVTAGGGSITPSSVTDPSGFATATRVLGTAVGADSATASVGGLVGSPQPFGATALAGNPAQIFKTAGDAQTATVNQQVATAPQVQVTDRAGNPIASANVTFTLGAASGSISPSSPAVIATDGSGFAQLTSWTLDTTAGTDNVVATSAGTPGATFSATGTPDAPSAGLSGVADFSVAITACSTGCTVAGSRADSVMVTVRDQFGNAINGASVNVSSTGTGNTFSPSASGLSNASGVFTTKLNSTVAQAKTISATATTALGGGAINQQAVVTVNPTAVSTTFSSVAASVSPITACQTSCVLGSTALSLTATVRDTFNNIISGASVTLGANGTNNYFNAVLQNSISGSTGGAGTYSANFNSGTAQLKTLSATITSGVVIGENTSATVNAASPSSIVINGGNGQSARVGLSVLTDPSVLVRDAFLNPVPNVTVTFSVTGGGGSAIAPTTPLTNASGIATVGGFIMGGSSADDGLGRMPNTMSASATGAGSTTFTEYGIYTWSGDVNPIIGTPTTFCSGCHSWTQANIVGVAGTGGCAAFTRVVAGSAGSSMLYTKMTGPLPCGTNLMPPPPAGGMSAANLKIVRAWINNGALNN